VIVDTTNPNVEVPAAPESTATETTEVRLADVAPSMDDFRRVTTPSARFVKKFMDGRMTPEEVWRQHVIRNRPCFGCGSPKGAIVIRVFMPFVEAMRRNEPLMQDMARWAVMNGMDTFPTVQFGNPPEDFIRVSEKVACDRCKATAERAAARGPSWVVVEIKRGPGDINPVVQAARIRKK